jgi:thioredoxin
MVVVLNDENFNKEVLSLEKPVLVDFWMNGCPPCSLLSPVLEKLEKEFSSQIIIAKANLDETPLIIQKYGINAAPTIILFKDGKPVSGFVGFRPEQEIRIWLEENLRKDNGEN